MLLGKTKIPQAKLRGQILGCAVLVCGFLVVTPFSQKKLVPLTDPTIQRATQLLELGNLNEAETLLQGHLSKKPNDVRTKILLGVVFDRQDRLAQAESIYRDVLKTRPNEI